MSELHDNIHAEILAFHRFLVAWFTGEAPHTQAFFDAAMARFDPDFELIPPNGRLLTLEALSRGLFEGHGSNPEFEIEIRNVRRLRSFELNGEGDNSNIALVAYEEWQSKARNSTPSHNGRVSTGLFRESAEAPHGWIWLNLHETRLPT